MFKKLILPILLILIPALALGQEISEKDAFLVAKDAYDEESYSISLDLFKRFIEEFPYSPALPEAQLYRAQCFFQDNKFIQARDILAQLEKSYIPYGIEDRFLFWSGQVYLKVEDFREAAKYFEKLIELYPNSTLLFNAKMYLGWAFLEDGRYDKAENIFDSLTKSQDLAVQEEALFKKGEALFHMKDYGGVLDNYRIFVKVFSNSDRLTKIYFYLAESCFYLEDFEKAIEYYSNILERSDDDLVTVVSLQGIGWSYLKENKLKEAERAFLKTDLFLDVDFNKENLFFGKATLYYRLGQFDEAIIYYDKLIGIYPKSEMIIQVLFAKAECLFGLSRFEEAIDSYKEVIEKGGHKSSIEIKEVVDKAYYSLGWTYFTTSNFNSALPQFQEALSLSNNEEVRQSALYYIGEIYQKDEEFKKAIRAYSRILRDYPDSSYGDYAQYHIGLTQLKSEEVDSAILSFKEFNKNFVQSDLLDDVNYYLGYAYFRNNEFRDACGQFQKFLDAFLNSTYTDRTTYLLAVSFYNRGMFRKAIENFEKIIKDFRQNKDLVEKAEYAIANALYELGEEKLAISKFKEFIDKYADSEIAPKIIFWLGQYYHENSLYEIARKNFEKIIRMYPRNNLAQEAKYEIGLTFLREDKLDYAMKTFRGLLEEDYTGRVKLKTMLITGDLLLEQDKIDEAIQMYKDLLYLASSDDLDSSVSKITTNENDRELEFKEFLDYTEEEIKTKDLIIQSGEFAYKETSSDVKNQFVKLAFIRLGDLYKENNNFTEAINAYTEAMKHLLEESSAHLQFKIAECLEEQQRFDASIEQYLKIPFLYEQDKFLVVKGLFRVARIYEDRENWKEAIKIYEQILDYDVAEAKYAKEKIELIKKKVK
ncbi:tetratricopeptide repeat protein [bacterium]|nr:tetratricopeptide repeat protein [bacterium]